ncbi:unnamed protein product [Sphagnum compactum]
MGSAEEPERKRRQLNNNNNHTVNTPLKKQPSAPSADDKKVDAAILQYQNQKLAQQLDFQLTEISALENRCNQLKSKQVLHDETLMMVNGVWNQVLNELESLALKASVATNGIPVSESASSIKERGSTLVPPQEIFLNRLLERGATESSTTKESNGSVETGLAAWKVSVGKTMNLVVKAIDFHRVKNEELLLSLQNVLSTDEAGLLLKRTDEEFHLEVGKLRAAMDALHLKHREILAEAGSLQDCHAKDQSEIMRLRGELDEVSEELQKSRHKLATLRSQKEAAGGPLIPAAIPGLKVGCGNQGLGSEKASEGTCELEAGLVEMKALADQRLQDLQEALQKQLHLSEKIQHMQDLLESERHILLSHPYQLLTDQVQYLRSEIERCQRSVDQLQGERDTALCHEKEVILKAEAGEAARKLSMMSDARAAELETKLQNCRADKDTMHLRLEEASQVLGRKESVAELKMVVTTIHKEMRMMQAQLNSYKNAASVVHSLRAEMQSMDVLLKRQTGECGHLAARCADQTAELNLLKAEVQAVQNNEQELSLFLSMLNRESSDPREVIELQLAERRAWAQVERLKAALDEHSLELRVKAANEAEAACQQRLTAAEAEITELQQSLDASDRAITELTEELKIKNEEGDAYISEIETIGQAYEDMQTQNQRLLQQITERDDYNSQLMSESLKAKQLQTSLQAEKQVLASRMQHAHAAVDVYKQRVTRLEEQVKTFVEQLGRATDESQQYASSLESAKRRSVEMEKELAATKSALEATNKGLEVRGQKLSDVQTELQKERFEKRRIQEKIDALNAKVAHMNSYNDGGPLGERLQEEINQYKAILKCSVCHDRPKEVVITKCYHLFCGPCIQRNLELRHRKCPGCGVPFGQNDVRNVYI